MLPHFLHCLPGHFLLAYKVLQEGAIVQIVADKGMYMRVCNHNQIHQSTWFNIQWPSMAQFHIALVTMIIV
jgi:hypothetical protein